MAADSRGRDSEAAQPPSGQEVTPVGRVSKNLLELSDTAAQNQNTRAYQAPAELLERARRQRERAAARPSVKPHSIGPAALSAPPQPATSRRVEAKPQLNDVKPRSGGGKIQRVEVTVPRPSEDEAAPPRPIGESLPPRERPTHRPGRLDDAAESSAPNISVNPASSSDSVNYLDDGEPADSYADDAAPPVARSRPSRALSDPSGIAESAPRPPASLRELLLAASNPDAPRSIAAPSEESSPHGVASSERISTTTRHRTYYWMLLVVAFIALGFALGKWPALDLLFSR